MASPLRLIALIKTEDVAKKILTAMHLPTDVLEQILGEKLHAMELPRPTHDSFQLRLAAEGHNMVLAAGVAKEMGKASPQDASAEDFAHETGHYFGLQHWGPAADGQNDFLSLVVSCSHETLVRVRASRCNFGFGRRDRVQQLRDCD